LSVTKINREFRCLSVARVILKAFPLLAKT
jgi:hypothetical protein